MISNPLHNTNPQHDDEKLMVRQLSTLLMFRFYEPGIRHLIEHYKDILLDVSCGESTDVLIHNLQASLPHLWLVVDENATLASEDRVKALVTLTDEIPNRHAFIHGVSHPNVRRHPVLMSAAICVMNYAFDTLNVLKVKAEFEAHNKHAKGFCWRYGFQREGYFKHDNVVQNQLHDVVIYSLKKQRFEQWLKKNRNTLFKNSTTDSEFIGFNTTQLKSIKKGD